MESLYLSSVAKWVLEISLVATAISFLSPLISLSEVLTGAVKWLEFTVSTTITGELCSLEEPVREAAVACAVGAQQFFDTNTEIIDGVRLGLYLEQTRTSVLTNINVPRCVSMVIASSKSNSYLTLDSVADLVSLLLYPPLAVAVCSPLYILLIMIFPSLVWYRFDESLGPLKSDRYGTVVLDDKIVKRMNWAIRLKAMNVSLLLSPIVLVWLIKNRLTAFFRIISFSATSWLIWVVHSKRFNSVAVSV
jgi:hypothetical protein